MNIVEERNGSIVPLEVEAMKLQTVDLPGGFRKIGLVMNSAAERSKFHGAAPNPMPATHCQAVEWERKGNLDILWLYPTDHPMETVAAITDHFQTLDEPRLKYLCTKAGIDISSIRLSQMADDGLPKTETAGMVKLLQEKFPMPKGKVFPIPPKTQQIREKVIVLHPDVAEMDVKTLEKTAAQAGGINTFKAQQMRGATISQLRELVTRLKDKKRAQDERERSGRARLLTRT